MGTNFFLQELNNSVKDATTAVFRLLSHMSAFAVDCTVLLHLAMFLPEE